MSGIFKNVYDKKDGLTKSAEKAKGTSPAILSLEETKAESMGKKSATKKATILPTVLKVTTDEIAYWTNMTCFYDKYWEFDPKFSTVPISFMHITSVTEIITAQGSEKRVILYEAPESINGSFNAATSSHPAYKNNLDIIMDNVIVQPKQYQMEVIIPDSLIGPFHRQGMGRLQALLDYMSLTTDSGTVDKRENKKIGNMLRGVQIFFDVVDKVSSLADLVLGVAGGSSQMATMNKNSIEAMAKKGRVVLFKKWTGYDYSYGIITKIDISKKPSENGVYRGSITFQETPILNISRKQSSVLSGASSFLTTATQAARYLNLAMSYPFIQLTGVLEEAGDVGSDTADGGTGFDMFR